MGTGQYCSYALSLMVYTDPTHQTPSTRIFPGYGVWCLVSERGLPSQLQNFLLVPAATILLHDVPDACLNGIQARQPQHRRAKKPTQLRAEVLPGQFFAHVTCISVASTLYDGQAGLQTSMSQQTDVLVTFTVLQQQRFA